MHRFAFALSLLVIAVDPGGQRESTCLLGDDTHSSRRDIPRRVDDWGSVDLRLSLHRSKQWGTINKY